MPFCIGIDLDNTIVSYDSLFRQLAMEAGLVPEATPSQKEAIRDAIRRSSAGNAAWTRLQALAYGPRMGSAEVFPGVLGFFERCLQAGYRTYIVSHKTETAALDGPPVFLRKAAVEWLQQRGFFSGTGLSREHVFFESTRFEKVERIAALGCTHFIDDLPEVFEEKNFPRQTERFLFSPHERASFPERTRVASSWAELERHFFQHGT
jgi:hypothetical protein